MLRKLSHVGCLGQAVIFCACLIDLPGLDPATCISCLPPYRTTPF